MNGGALDAWVVPVVGKRGRPAHVVSFLTAPEKVASLARVLTGETGTLGYREHRVARSALARHVVEVEVKGQRVRVKAGPYRAKAEYEDCARAGAALGLPVGEVARLAEQQVEMRPD